MHGLRTKANVSPRRRKPPEACTSTVVSRAKSSYRTRTGTAMVTKQGPLWTIKGRLDSVAPGTEGDWVSIDGTVERIAAGNVTIRGEVAFRVAKEVKEAI